MTKRIIGTLSGGVASAHACYLAKTRYKYDKFVLYFNDTKWEHPDLYRFLKDVSDYLKTPITDDSDGRSVEDLAWDQSAIPNNRMPFCSRILKAERLQKFFEDGDTLVFGIGPEESMRADRIKLVYQEVARKTKKHCSLMFPLIDYGVTKEASFSWLDKIGIQIPELYKKGFSHNNCYGGCVRAGKKQWKRLLDTFPEIYKQREQLEKEMTDFHGRRCTILKDESLTEFRLRCEKGLLGKYYDDDDNGPNECIGICTTEN